MQQTQKVLSLLFPATCVSCRADLPAERPRPVCELCWRAFPWRPTLSLDLDPFNDCLIPTYFDGPLKKVIYSYKYSGRDYLSRFLAEMWLSGPGERKGKWDVVVPVPSPFWKEVQRGYNPSGLFGQRISRVLGLPFRPKTLKRRWLSPSQTNLGREDRQNNAMRSYFVNSRPHLIKGKRVLLVDDVVTTGATLKTCANLLLKMGAKSISGAAIAYEKQS